MHRVIACTTWIVAMVTIATTHSAVQSTRAGSSRAATQPVLDMHMHARTAAHYGATALPMCAPVDIMPRWDQRRPFGEYDSSAALCRTPLVSPSTNEDVLGQTIASMRRHHVIGVLGGEPQLVAKWVAAFPGRSLPVSIYGSITRQPGRVRSRRLVRRFSPCPSS